MGLSTHAHLFEPLPILKIEPLEETQNGEDPYHDLIMDKRTGKQYWISTDDGCYYQNLKAGKKLTQL